jgi:uncharacterized protein YjbI with pentapeptide repeats
MDQYLFNFIQNEVAELPYKEQLGLQQIFIKLLRIAIREGSPMDKVGLLHFADMLKQSKNSETALLAIHSACAQSTLKTSELLCENFDGWLRRVSSGYGNEFVNRTLQGLDLSSTQLGFIALHGVYLNKADLSSCILVGVSFTGGQLREVNLNNAEFISGNLENTNLTGAKLQSAQLRQAYLKNACFRDADLNNADLEEANLESASFEKANLEGASFKGANLKKANFKGANLEGANFEGADLDETNFAETILEKTLINIEIKT